MSCLTGQNLKYITYIEAPSKSLEPEDLVESRMEELELIVLEKYDVYSSMPKFGTCARSSDLEYFGGKFGNKVHAGKAAVPFADVIRGRVTRTRRSQAPYNYESFP